MTWLEEVWWREGPARPRAALPALAVAAQAFRAGVAGRDAVYRSGIAPSRAAPVAVISVGNLVVGGAGKTPATIVIAERLLRRGRRVAVLSRGYGARGSSPRLVSDGARVLLDAADAGDEPALIARRVPGAIVACGPDRAALARRAVAELGADAVLLDDGFQHRRLARDLDVVVLDAGRPVGNGHLLPRGPNREPWSALRRAQLGWIARCDQADPARLEALRERVAAATGRAPVASRYSVADVLDGSLARSHGAGALAGARVLALCALARPDGFRATLAALGAEVVAERSFRDHHPFTDAELDAALRDARAAGCDAVATTEKDAVRLPAALAADPLWRVVRIDAEIVAGASALDALLDEALARGDARRLEVAPARRAGAPAEGGGGEGLRP